MKLYFMIGLPTEEDEDVREIVRDRRARARRRQARRSANAARPAEGHGQRLDARAQAAHAVSVVRDGHATSVVREKQSWLERRGARQRASSSACTTRDDVVARRRLRARRSHARRRARARVPERRALRLVGRAAQARRLGGGVRRTTASIPASYLGTIPVTRAPAVGPHRRRPRGGLPAARVPQGAEEPPQPAVRQGRGRVRPPHEPRGRATPTSASSFATTAASRATSRRCATERLVYLAQARRRRRARADAPKPPPEVARRRREAEARPAAARSCRARRAATASSTRSSGRCAFLSHLDLDPRAAARRSAALERAALLLVGLPPEARHDVRAGALARRREPRRGPRREAHASTSTPRRSRDELTRVSPEGLVFKRGARARDGTTASIAKVDRRRALRGRHSAQGARRDRRRSAPPRRGRSACSPRPEIKVDSSLRARASRRRST